MPFTLLLLQVSIHMSTSQFPTVCMDSTSLSNKKCCPPYDGSECGSDDGRGRCESITLPVDKTMTSVRDAWPYYFDRVCICAHNFSGYDCGRCKYGHYGVNCNSSIVVDRRPISEYSPHEWEDYVNILAQTKMHDSGYLVFLNEPQSSSDPSQLPQTNNDIITLYNLFVWQHHYPAKDSENNVSKKDYAHESTGFPTWHRQFLLWFEWEVQYMLQDKGREDYYMFRIPYWDWRKEKQTDNNSPFKSNRLGETLNNNGLPKIHHGNKILNEWETICWSTGNHICNPDIATGQLQRCPLKDSCSTKNELWPSDKDVQTVLSLREYDTFPYSRKAASSFRNQLEGFRPLSSDDIEFCRENKLCTCKRGEKEDFNCTESDVDGGPQPTDPIQRLLHNSVHIILGLGYFGSDAQTNESIQGVMADVAASANDPIFLNHHAMVDCIFETWLQKNPDAQYPVNNDIRKGHRQTDYIVPFFPLYTHGDMFSTAEMFGYRCTIQSDKSGLPSWAIILISVVVPVVGLGLIMFCLVIVCIKMSICSCKCNKLRAYIRGYGGLDGANSDKTASPLEQSA